MPQAEHDDSIEPPDAIEPSVGSPDVQMLVETIKELTAKLAATNARLEAAERAALPPPAIIWLPLKAAGYRAGGLSSECMRKWTKLGRVESRREGDLIFINKASLDARLARLGRRPR